VRQRAIGTVHGTVQPLLQLLAADDTAVMTALTPPFTATHPVGSRVTEQFVVDAEKEDCACRMDTCFPSRSLFSGRVKVVPVIAWCLLHRPETLKTAAAN